MNTDSDGSSVNNSIQIEWQATNGPTNSYISSIAVHPNGTVFSGTQRGLYRYSAEKKTWSLLQLSESINSVRSIEFDQQGNIYAGCGGGNIYRSSDLGEHWINIWTGLTNDVIIDMIVLSNNHILAGTNSGMYRSTDHGNFWSKINNGLPTNVVINSFANSTNALLAGGDGGSGIFRSWNNGVTWESVNTFTDGLSVTSLIIDGSNRIFAGTLYRGVFVSTDFGTSWSYSGLNNASRVYNFALDSVENIFVSTNAGVYKLSVNKTTWDLVPTDLPVSTTPTQIISDKSNHLYAGTSSYGVIGSTDNGKNWPQYNRGFEPEGIAVLTTNGNGVIFAGTYGTGNLYSSSDEGESWARMYTGIGTSSILSLAVTQQGRIFAGSYNSSIIRSTDNGISWSQFFLGNIVTSITALTASSNGNVYAGTEAGQIFRSMDHGESWILIDSTAGHKKINSLFVYSNKIYSCTRSGGVFRSSDDGATWEQITSGLTNLEARTIVASSSGDLFVGTWGGGIYRSVDAGSSWFQTKAYKTSPYIRSLGITQKGTLYAGIGFDGLMKSTDNGNTWIKSNGGLNSDEIDAIVVLPNGKVVVGGGGIYKSK